MNYVRGKIVPKVQVIKCVTLEGMPEYSASKVSTVFFRYRCNLLRPFMYTISKRRDREKTYLDVAARPISPPTIPSDLHLLGIDLPAKKVGQDPIAM